MNNFSKEYIKEADCEEIQGLKKVLDYCSEVAIKVDNHKYEENIYRAFSKGINDKYLFSYDWNGKDVYFYKRSMVVWLPTGGQLDEEIVKICKEKDLRYDFSHNEDSFSVSTIDKLISDDTDLDIEIENINPLIAKIKLLKQLLK